MFLSIFSLLFIKSDLFEMTMHYASRNACHTMLYTIIMAHYTRSVYRAMAFGIFEHVPSRSRRCPRILECTPLMAFYNTICWGAKYSWLSMCKDILLLFQLHMDVIQGVLNYMHWCWWSRDKLSFDNTSFFLDTSLIPSTKIQLKDLAQKNLTQYLYIFSKIFDILERASTLHQLRMLCEEECCMHF